MNFTSQICTTKEQSEQLLALGLKKETADCFLEYVGRDNHGNNVWHPSTIVNNYRMPDYSRDFPAWSLHRLIDLCPHYRIEVGISYVSWDYRNEFPKDFTKHKDTYNNLIDCIEWLIKTGYFNKEYLEEK